MGLLPSTKAGVAGSILGDRNRLVMQQLPQVRFIAQRIHSRLPHHVQLEDLVNTGVVGLIEALGKFDPGRRVELKSYASYRIRGAILDSLREQDWGPRLLRQKGRQLEDARQKLLGRLGRAPSQPELAAELGVTEDELHSLMNDLQGLTLSSLHGNDSLDGSSLSEMLVARNDDSPYEVCRRSEMDRLLAEAVSKLSTRKQRILELYYFKGMTMKEVGAHLGVCESRISQMHTAAMASLRARMKDLSYSRRQPAAAPRPAITEDHETSTSRHDASLVPAAAARQRNSPLRHSLPRRSGQGRTSLREERLLGIPLSRRVHA